MLHLRIFAVICALALLAAACASGSDAGPTATAIAPMTVEEASTPGQFGVGLRTLQMVDASRPTEPNREYPGSPQREMEVDVYYPVAAAADGGDGPLDGSGGPYPLVIAAHGYGSPRGQLAPYIRHLVSHGYIVAAPGFPQTRFDAPGGPRLYAILDQPADVSFVIDELFAMDANADSFLAGAIDEERIGMTGHSGGGLATMVTAYGPMRDGRIDAIVPISPVGCLVPPDIAGGVSVPAMIVGGSVDRLVPPPSIYKAYEAASAPRYFVEVIGGEHVRFGAIDIADVDLPDILDTVSKGDIDADIVRFAEGIGADPDACLEEADGTDELIPADRQRELLRAVSLPFFDAYLKDDPAAISFLEQTLPTLDGIRFETQQPSDTEGEQ